MDLTWDFAEPLEDDSLLDEFENEYRVSFSTDLKRFLKENNGGIPSKGKFDTDKSKGRVFNALYSFNKENAGNIFAMFPLIRRDNDTMLPFAGDVFGNSICLDKNGKIILLLHETGEIEFIANSIGELLKKLYE
jgi:hypothetical protein